MPLRTKNLTDLWPVFISDDDGGTERSPNSKEQPKQTNPFDLLESVHLLPIYSSGCPIALSQDSFRYEEYIVGGIRFTLLLAGMRDITTGCGCFATLGIDALDRSHTREHSLPAVLDHRN